MTPLQRPQALLEVARRGFNELGYRGGLLQQNYQFADIVDGNAIRRIDLATFGQEPPSYRTACFGITLSQTEELVAPSAYRALGAPQIFTLHPSEVCRWKMTAEGEPELQERFPPEKMMDVLRTHRDEWQPTSVLRAKAITFDATPVQLDFYDIGLVPTIESIVQDKLHRLLSSTVAEAVATYKRQNPSELDFPSLYRLIFRLLAAKVLADRQHPGEWLSNNPAEVVQAVEQFYFRTRRPGPVLRDPLVQDVTWTRIRNGFHFQNISVETLAHIYETTLVTPELRRRQSIHSTPPEIADYIVRRLPFQELPEDQRRVFEPFAGSGIFLVSALKRLRELLPTGLSDRERHDYFVRMLTGMENEPFAAEVSGLSLILADYPNPNGWRVIESDVFNDPNLSRYVAASRVVLCNPPFEDFTEVERQRYQRRRSANKAVEILLHVLDHPPAQLGFVLPRVFRDGRSYRNIRRQVAEMYQNVEMIELPDTAFNYSEAETVLLLAHGSASGAMHLRTSTVTKSDYRRFVITGRPSTEEKMTMSMAQAAQAPSLWIYPLHRIWQELDDYPRLGHAADVHRGIEYVLSVKEHRDELVSDRERQGFARGLLSVAEGFEPYHLRDHVFLNVSPHLMRTNAYQYPWDKPKVIANAARRTRGPWTVVAVSDSSGLVCYQNFIGIWPKDGIPIEVIAAILNGPIANAFISVRRTSRHNQRRLIENVPIPSFSSASIRTITQLVREYQALRRDRLGILLTDPDAETHRESLLQIDAEVLAAYDLPPRLERELLQYFSGIERPVPVSFTGYYPPSFSPTLPLRLALPKELERATARKTLERLPVLRDPIISQFVTELENDTDSEALEG